MAKAKTKLPGLNIALLTEIVNATNANSFVYVSQSDAAPFLAHVPALIEVNVSLLDASGKAATRATDAGKAMIVPPASGQAATSATVSTEKPKFAIANLPAPPAPKRGNKEGMTKYPFDDLAAPTFGPDGKPVSCAAFFIPATAEKPEPWLSLHSTCSSATRRFSVVNAAQPTKNIERIRYQPDGKTKITDAAGNVLRETVTVENLQTVREFVVREVADGAPFGFAGVKGAGIYRVK